MEPKASIRAPFNSTWTTWIHRQHPSCHMLPVEPRARKWASRYQNDNLGTRWPILSAYSIAGPETGCTRDECTFSTTVIADIFVHDLVSLISYFLQKEQNLVAYENHTRIQIALDTSLAVWSFTAYRSSRLPESGIFTRTKISAITVSIEIDSWYENGLNLL